jgi:glucose-1-phosphate thymidylyltransferase
MKAVGILPCAGLGLRMRPLRYPKELLPVCFHRLNDGQTIVPKLSIEYALEAFRIAGISQCYAVVADWKPEIMRYLGDGTSYGIDIGYLYNSKAMGLADAVFTMNPWASDSVTCLAMPDTQFLPVSAFHILLKKMEELGSDLVLGIFPTAEPECFAPVELDSAGRVVSVVDKPAGSFIKNTWGIAVWGASFWNFFQSVISSIPPGGSISEVFDGAAKAGLNVHGVFFEDGEYNDIGRYSQFHLFHTVEL